MKTDLSRINLNLLIAFDALVKEKHVTKAGKRLYISQSAMSNTLKQLRDVFHDELFIRGQKSRMVPTPRALELAPAVADALEKVTLIFDPPQTFNPKVARNTFTIGMSDYIGVNLLPQLMRIITRQAPGIDIIVKHINYLSNDGILENNDVDIAIGICPKISDKLMLEKLFEDKYICVSCHKNPLLKSPLSAETYAKAEHIVVLYFESRADLYSEQFIEKLGFKRRVVLTVPNALAAIECLPDTHLIAVLPSLIVKRLANTADFISQPAPFPCPPSEIKMAWHPKNKNDPAHRWLRETIIDITSRL